METGAQKQRIDKWLFFARIVKSRSLAAKIAAGGHVRVNCNKINRSSYGIIAGDVLTIALPRIIRVLRVLNGGERRGPASEAQLLYEDLSPPSANLSQEITDETYAAAPSLPQRPSGSGRPTKRERRATDKLKPSPFD